MDELVVTWDWPLISDGARGEWVCAPNPNQRDGWTIRWVPRELVESVLSTGSVLVPGQPVAESTLVQDPWDTW